MNEFERNRLFTRIARQYAEHEGEKLKQAARTLPEQPTPALDARVKGGVRALKRQKVLSITGAVAAAAVVAFLLLPNRVQKPPAGSEALRPTPGFSADSPAAPAEMLPLGFKLPESFSVANAELDNGMTVYTLENEMDERVMLTMKKSGDVRDVSGLRRYEINSSYAYGAYYADYSLLTFEQNGIDYELTCKYDLNTLIDLSKSILV